jgi:hypothetical protein
VTQVNFGLVDWSGGAVHRSSGAGRDNQARVIAPGRATGDGRLKGKRGCLPQFRPGLTGGSDAGQSTG